MQELNMNHANGQIHGNIRPENILIVHHYGQYLGSFKNIPGNFITSLSLLFFFFNVLFLCLHCSIDLF